ncbi:MAG: PIN domain-containing protein [Nitrospinae bacterium]|nr:PIN domain-containing protein [Nitrospinota bacterium]
MPPAGYFIDANLLVLLIVGRVGEEFIAKHSRLQQFVEEDYLILRNLLDIVDQVFVTPNTLTETSNLLAQHGEPERSRFFEQLRSTIEESREIHVVSEVASQNREFRRLGLTDAALLEVATLETPLLTVDLDLYLAALTKDRDTAVNFRHIQNF